MIDPKLFDVERLVKAVLDRSATSLAWRLKAEIVPRYMPPHPGKDTVPRCVVAMTAESGERCFLRYSKGPRQGHFWDVYGDDYLTPELALMALADAEPPPPAFSITFVIPLKDRPTHDTHTKEGK